MPFDVNVSELLDETVNYFWDEDAMKFLSLNLGSFGAPPPPLPPAVAAAAAPAATSYNSYNYRAAAAVTTQATSYLGQRETASQRYGIGSAAGMGQYGLSGTSSQPTGHYGAFSSTQPTGQYGVASSSSLPAGQYGAAASAASSQPAGQYGVSGQAPPRQPAGQYGVSSGKPSSSASSNKYAEVASQWDEMMKAVSATPVSTGQFAHRLDTPSVTSSGQQQPAGKKKPNYVSDTRFKQLDAIIDVGIKTDPDGFEGRLESFKPLQAFIQAKMANMQSEYGVSDGYIMSVATVIPR